MIATNQNVFSFFQTSNVCVKSHGFVKLLCLRRNNSLEENLRQILTPSEFQNLVKNGINFSVYDENAKKEDRELFVRLDQPDTFSTLYAETSAWQKEVEEEKQEFKAEIAAHKNGSNVR